MKKSINVSINGNTIYYRFVPLNRYWSTPTAHPCLYTQTPYEILGWAKMPSRTKPGYAKMLSRTKHISFFQNKSS
jgi:hypothetical protein